MKFLLEVRSGQVLVLATSCPLGAEPAIFSGHCLEAQGSPAPQAHQDDQSINTSDPQVLILHNTRQGGRVVAIDPSCGEGVTPAQKTLLLENHLCPFF